VGAVLVLAGLAACGSSGVAQHAPVTIAPQTPQVPSLTTIRTEYGWAVSYLNSAATSFKTELDDAMRTKDGQVLYGACQGLAGALLSFDVSASAIKYPIALKNQVHSMLAADAALEKDLQAIGSAALNSWLSKWRSDVVTAQTMHDGVTHPLGLPDDRFLTII